MKNRLVGSFRAMCCSRRLLQAAKGIAFRQEKQEEQWSGIRDQLSARVAQWGNLPLPLPPTLFKAKS